MYRPPFLFTASPLLGRGSFMNHKWQIWVYFLPFWSWIQKGEAFSLCSYKSNIHTHTHTHTHTRRGQECDVLISSWLGRRFVCQLNNGLAGIKASHCHNYTPAGINPVYINVIIVRRVHTLERCISIRRDLLYLPRIVSLKLFVTPSQAHKDVTSGVVKSETTVICFWHSSSWGVNAVISSRGEC